MPASRQSLSIALLLALALPAQAGLFDDEEARKYILKVERESRERDTAIEERIGKLEAALKNLNLIELVGQLDQLRGEIAGLRGQIEVLNNQIATVDKKQRDFYLDIDSRLRRLEQPAGGATPADPAATAPPQPPLDPKEAAKRAAAEKKSYDAAFALFQKKNWAAAIPAFERFIADYPASPQAAGAQYWIGLAHYNLRDLKNALAAQQSLLKVYPDSPKVPDAWLAIAAIQADQGDSAGARNTLEDIIARYPGSDAATKARSRLASAGRQ